ncbi:MAG: ferritin-like domain-containing protein [Archangium sp.]|nr:ferritin-like domain-containing protein [Archangium sp.]
MQLRRVVGMSPDRAQSVVSTVGEVCKTAVNKATCETAFTALAPTTGFASACRQLCVDYHLATTRGDEVKALTTFEELKGLFGTIDTTQEAALLAFARGYSIVCGQVDQGGVKKTGTSFEVIGAKGFTCGPGTALTRFYLNVSADGDVTEKSKEVIQYGDPNCAIGRRPPGLETDGAVSCDEAVGRFFAEAAHLEAASVPAFERMFEELRGLGAPAALCEGALHAALEEIDHTRRTALLARRFGAEPHGPSVDARPLRTRFELALDNAVEGCVRESFGALVAHHQAAHANDGEVRAAMVAIAEDETSHAELSWATHEWLWSGLDEAERAAVRAAQREAVTVLRQQLAAPVSPSVNAVAGLPLPHQALALFDAVADLWS